MNSKSKDPYINSLIYSEFTQMCPTRYQMIKYSTWRAYLISEIEAIPAERRNKKKGNVNYSQQFPHLAYSEDRRQFYDFIFKPTELNYDKNYKQHHRNDNISHFICRMLYCQDEAAQLSFLEVERRILEDRLRRILREGTIPDRKHLMEIMKKVLLALKEIDNSGYYDISIQQWEKSKNFITFAVINSQKNSETPNLYAKIQFQEAEAGIRKRRSYIHNKFVYVGTEFMIDVILSNYDQFLRKKLQKTKSIVQNLLSEDIENQFNAFLIGTLKQINEEKMEQEKLHGKFNITLKNIDAVSKYFPPCMLNLNQHLKINRHLKHDGRRQLWGFFKACGMDVYDNKQYFRRHLEGKVTASQMKTHMYNIEHAYGLQGKKKAENPWKCRNIITGTAPKKGEYHGCPFYHWRTEQISSFIRSNYKVSQDKLRQIIAEKEEKHFQVACGRLFEYNETNSCNGGTIPSEITGKLGKAPYLFYEAGMELREKKIKAVEGDSLMKLEVNGSTDF